MDPNRVLEILEVVVRWVEQHKRFGRRKVRFEIPRRAGRKLRQPRLVTLVSEEIVADRSSERVAE